MTIYIKLPKFFNRDISYEISDVYAMAVTFIVTFYATKLLQDAYQKLVNKRKLRKQQYKLLFNSSGKRGGLNDKLYQTIIDSTPVNDNELFEAVLECIKNDKDYLVLSERLKRLIFAKVRAKIHEESIYLTPNLIRVLAKVSYESSSSIIMKVGNLIVSTNNKNILKARLVTTFAVAVFAKLTSLVGYSVLLLMMVFQETSYVDCKQYFQELPKTETQTIDVIAEKDTGVVVVANNNDDRQVEIYIPEPDVVAVQTGKEKTYTRKYKLAKKKAREVRFSDFRKEDPVLSKFNQDEIPIDEPLVPETNNKFFRTADVVDIIDAIIE